MALRYREASLDDAALASDVMTASYPALPQDPVMTRFRWQNLRQGHAVGRFLAEEDGAAVAFVAWAHGPWDRLPDRHCEVEVWLRRSRTDRRLLHELWSWVEAQAVREGARLLVGYAGEDEADMLATLAALGYARERTEKAWVLDLNAHGARLVAEAAAACAQMRSAGVRVLTVADWDDPARMRKLHRLKEETLQDIPHSVPIVPEEFEDFERRFHSPDRRTDRWWIAVDGDRAVAMSFLKYPPERGAVWTGYTCVDRGHRGRGIARAVKLQTLAQAVRLGVPEVHTDNDSENAPMLHINEKLGYVRRPGWIEHHKRVDMPRG